MIIRKIQTAAVIGVVFAMCLSFEAEAQNLVANGSFDMNTSGWTLSGGVPDTTVSWDGSDGSPSPGSLRLSSTLVPPMFGTAIEVFSDCFNTIPDEILTLTAMVKKPAVQSGVTCFSTLVLYEGLDCTGSRLFTGNVAPNTVGVWEQDETILRTTPFLSARVSLSMALLGMDASEKVCLFDTVELSSDRRGPAVVIPTLSQYGLVAFILVLAMAAVARFGRSQLRA